MNGMEQLGRGLLAIGVQGWTVAEVLMAAALEQVKQNSRTEYPALRERALAQVARFAGLAAEEAPMDAVLLNAARTAWEPARILQALLKHLTDRDGWTLLSDLRHGWSHLEPGTTAREVLLMYAALEQEAADANQAPPVIEAPTEMKRRIDDLLAPLGDIFDATVDATGRERSAQLPGAMAQYLTAKRQLEAWLSAATTDADCTTVQEAIRTVQHQMQRLLGLSPHRTIQPAKGMA